MSKYEVGYKAIVEIDKVFEQDGEKLYRAKGMKSLVFDGKGLDKLEPIDKYKIVNLNMGRVAGQNEAWELARKIVDDVWNGGYSEGKLKQIFGYAISQLCIVKNTYHEAAAKVAQWEKAKEEIKVGDVVSHEEKYGVVISEGTICFRGFTDDGTPFEWYKERCTKTGRHIDIDSFLKQIGGGDDEK